MSTSMTRSNLDRMAAQRAQQIVRGTSGRKATDDVENTVTKALGVLQENGVYACFLYLKAKEKDNGDVVVDEMLNLLDGLGFGWDKPVGTDPDTVLAYITEKVTVNLERLLLAKNTLEQMLIYARYGAKAKAKART